MKSLTPPYVAYCGVMQSVSAWIYTALHCTTLHCTALHCTTLHCTTLQYLHGTMTKYNWWIEAYSLGFCTKNLA